jgi:predicted metalloprotease with PDZ domain
MISAQIGANRPRSDSARPSRPLPPAMPRILLPAPLTGALALLAACSAAPSLTPSGPLEGPGATPAAERPAASYLVRIEDPTAGRVKVEFTLTDLGPGHEPLVVSLPRRFAFVELDAPLLEGEVQALDEDGGERAVEPIDPFRWSVERAGAKSLHFSITVPLHHRDLPEVIEHRDSYEFPYLAADHGMLVAGAMLPSPEFLLSHCLQSHCRVRFELPEGWAVRCPWPEVTDGVFEPPTRASLHNDLIAIGKWEERVVEANGCSVTVVVAPGQEGLMEAVGSLIEQIVRAEIELFGRRPREKYLFLFGRPDPPLSPDERGLSLGGSPKSGSMTLMLRGPVAAARRGSHLGHLIAHEFHHTWVHPSIETPGGLRFVGEGFTDYYAYLLLAREGLSSWDSFAATIAEKLGAYCRNPVREELSLLEAGGPCFFEGKGAYSLTYDGGLLFAALLDRMIRAPDEEIGEEIDEDIGEVAGEERSLDEAMRAFRNDPRWAEGGTAPTVENFFESLAGFLSAEEVAHLRELAGRRGEIDFLGELRATGAEIEAVDGRPTFRVEAGPWREHRATNSDR